MEKCINGVSFDGKSVTNSIYSLEKMYLTLVYSLEKV